jgi:hypothetical protein
MFRHQQNQEAITASRLGKHLSLKPAHCLYGFCNERGASMLSHHAPRFK